MDIARVERGDGEHTLVCLGDHLPELFEFLLLHGTLVINEAIEQARHLEVEDIEGGLEGDLNVERMLRGILCIKVLLVDDARKGFLDSGRTGVWNFNCISSSVNGNAEWILVEHNVEVLNNLG